MISAEQVDRFGLGYQAGVVQALDAIVEFLTLKEYPIPYGIRDAALKLLDGERSE